MTSHQYGPHGRQYIPPVRLKPHDHFLLFEVVGATVRGERSQLNPWRLPTSANPRFAHWRKPCNDRRLRRIDGMRAA